MGPENSLVPTKTFFLNKPKFRDFELDLFFREKMLVSDLANLVN